MVYSPRDYVRDRLDTLLAFRRILDCRLPFWDDFNEASHCLIVFMSVSVRLFFLKSIFCCRGKKTFEVWEHTSIVYVHTPSFFKKENG